MMPTLVTSADQPQLDALKATIDSLDDPMIAATVHMYGPWPFSVNIAGGTTYSEQVEQEITSTFERVHDTFVADEIPVIIGEWGVLGYDWTRPIVPSQQYGELLKFFEGMTFQARDKQMTLMLWDAGSYLNRDTLEWRDPLVQSYMDSGVTTRSGTASFDSIYLEKAGTIADESLTLNRNGLEFEGLWQGDTALAEGADYTVDGDTLTLTAAALTRLAGDRDVRHERDDRGALLGRCAVADPHHQLRHAGALGCVRDHRLVRDPDRVLGRPDRHDGGQIRRRHQRRTPRLDLLQGVLGDLPPRLHCGHDRPHP